MARKTGLNLRCKAGGGWERAAFTVRAATDGTPGGAEVWMACDFGRGVGLLDDEGGHWLAPDPRHPDRVVAVARRWVWPSVPRAQAALDQWERAASAEDWDVREASIDDGEPA